MKTPLPTRLNLTRSLRATVNHYPVESVLCLHAFVLFVLTREAVLYDTHYHRLTAVLICRRTRDNRRLVTEALSSLGAGIMACVLAGIAAALFLAIYFPVIYIFGIPNSMQDGMAVYTLAVTFLLLMPLLWFAAFDRLNTRVSEARRTADVLHQFIVTPALLAYTALLYPYLPKVICAALPPPMPSASTVPQVWPFSSAT